MPNNLPKKKFHFFSEMNYRCTNFTNFIFRRAHPLEDACPSNYLNEKWCIEWDSWDHDRQDIRTRSKLFGWPHCSSTFLQTCPHAAKANTSALELPPRAPERIKFNANISTDDFFSENKTKTSSTLLDSEGTAESYAVFWDLNPTPLECKFVGNMLRQSVHSMLTPVMSTGMSGRSMDANLSPLSKAVIKDKEKSKEKALKIKLEKAKLAANVINRHEHLEELKRTKTMIRKLARMSGLGEYYSLKEKPELMERFLKLGNVSKLIKYVEKIEKNGTRNLKRDRDFLFKGEEHISLLVTDEEDPKLSKQRASQFGRSFFSKFEHLGRTVGERNLDIVDSIAHGKLCLIVM